MKKLKYIIILALCLQITVPFVVEECLRFPVLVSHFLHHNHHHEKTSFITFVSTHYSKNHHDENHDEHEKLPFHKDCDHSFNQTLVFNPEIIQVLFQTNFNYKEPKKIAFKQNHFQSNVSINIWKPPKIS